MAHPTARTPRSGLWSALAGVVAAAGFLAAAEVVALLVPGGSPLLAVGSFTVDVVPRPIKELAIELFGAQDKLVLLIGLGLAVAAAAAIAGDLERRRPPLGALLLGVAGALALAATVTRAGASPWSALPPLAGTAAGILVLRALRIRLERWRDAAAPIVDHAGADRRPTTAAGANPGVERRRFLRFAGLAAAASVAAGIGARVVGAATSSIQAARDALRLPAPASTVDVPEGASFDIAGLSPLYTPNADFYRVDTALTVPRVDPATWRLRITGMVDEDVTLSFEELVAMGVDEYSITLTCVSNVVGGELVGTARWLGVPVRDVLARARPTADADMLLSRSVDGFTASTPLEVVTDPGRDAILAIAMNGEPLPLEHGFPVRMVVPGLYGYVSATKWLTELKVTTFAEDEAYWTPRGYSARAPIKLSSRIDTPRSGTPIGAGPTRIAGVAWAQPVGVETVEVDVDGTGWQPATVSTPVNGDTWVQWYLDWDASPGSHFLTVRARDRAGKLQLEERTPIAPDGSTGWQNVLVRVRG